MIIDSTTGDIGLLVVRIVFGLYMAAHGAQKLLGWFGGHGLAGTAGFFDSLGFRPSRPLATVAASSEVASGLLVAFGLLGPIGPALMLAVMVVAMSVHWSNGAFSTRNGVEVPLLYAALAVALALTGPGRLSLDWLLGLEALSQPLVAPVALAVGLVGGVANLVARRAARKTVGA